MLSRKAMSLIERCRSYVQCEAAFYQWLQLRAHTPVYSFFRACYNRKRNYGRGHGLKGAARFQNKTTDPTTPSC